MVIATDLMTVEVPKAAEDRTVSDLFSAIRQRPWEELSHIYLVGCQGRLTGQVPIESLLTAEGRNEALRAPRRPSCRSAAG